MVFKLKSPDGMAVGVIMLVVAIQILVQVLPELINSFINLSNVSNLSFASFFGANGVVLLLMSVAILIAIFGFLGVRGKGR